MILKIIGIILLAILGVLILLLCIFLFSPICYQGTIHGEDTPESINAHVQVSWLLHLFSAWFSFEHMKTQWGLRMICKKYPEAETSSKKKDKKSSTIKKAPIETAPIEQVPIEKVPIEKVPTEIPVAKEQRKTCKTDVLSPHSVVKKENFLQKIKKWFVKIKCTILKIYDNIKRLLGNKDTLITFTQSKTHKAAFTKGKKELFHLLKYIKPKKFNMNFRFGFEDPYITGQILALLSMFYPLIGNNADIIPDFEHVVFQGSILIKGKIRVIYLVMIALRLLINKQVRRTIKDIKNFKFDSI
ncbi:MAG: DUF2953 domain-containing protein [Lachnospiraceae bacterium]